MRFRSTNGEIVGDTSFKCCSARTCEHARLLYDEGDVFLTPAFAAKWERSKSPAAIVVCATCKALVELDWWKYDADGAERPLTRREVRAIVARRNRNAA
jgi:hypothetical protein